MNEPGFLNKLARTTRQQVAPKLSATQLAHLRRVSPGSQGQIELAANMSWSVFTDITAALGCTVTVTVTNGDNIRVQATTEAHRTISEAIEDETARQRAVFDLIDALHAHGITADTATLALFLAAALMRSRQGESDLHEHWDETGYQPSAREYEESLRRGVGIELQALASQAIEETWRPALLKLAGQPTNHISDSNPTFQMIESLNGLGSSTDLLLANFLAHELPKSDWEAWIDYLASAKPHVADMQALGSKIADDAEFRNQLFHSAGWAGTYTPRRERRKDD